jgi:hypothetical protein
MPIDRDRLKATGLFKQFWTGKHPGLSHQGLDEVNRAGAEELVRYAREHNVDGTASPAGQQTIDGEEQVLMQSMLEDTFYGSLFELDARPELMNKFGLQAMGLNLPVVAARPQAAPAVALPERVSRFSAEALAGHEMTQLGDEFAREYSKRKTYFEDPMLDKEEKGRRVLGLFRDYTQALWAGGQRTSTEKAGYELLYKFIALPYSDLGGKDFNGAGFSAAQSLVLGIDPFNFKHSFPEATNEAKTTYLAMNDWMAPAMKYVDDYLKAKGVVAPQAEAFEKRPVLGHLLGQPSGHTKSGSLNETLPFSSSGLNWGVALFPSDPEVKSLPPRSDFEFPLDVLSALRDPIYVAAHDRIEVRDANGKALVVEKQIQRDVSGKGLSWSAKFKNAAGEEVPPDEVIGVIVDPQGRVKGDGKAEDVADMAWWGFCDRNAAQKLYKARFQIPELDRSLIKVKVGSTVIAIPKEQAQMLIDADVPDLAQRKSFIGFRYNGSPETIALQNGKFVQGKVKEDVMRQGPGTARLGDDDVEVFDVPGQPLAGSVLVDDYRTDAQDIVSITEGSQPGTVTVTSKWSSHTGRVFDVLPWDKAVVENGKRVIKQDDTLPIRGSLTVETLNGTRRIAVKDVKSISGEAKEGTRFSSYLAYIGDSEGMYATDSVLDPLVSNGERWVNKIELDEKIDGTRPAWLPATKVLTGLQGKLELRPGDKVVYARGMYRYGEHTLATNVAFSGWYQVRWGRIVNEGFISGEPDFAWGASGPLNWLAPSSFNPNMDPELRVALMVNGIAGMNDELATRLNLPTNWKSYQTPQS